MKRTLIIFSILIVGLLAFVDAKTRSEELEAITATTPSQVEMKREIPKSYGEGLNQKQDIQKQMALPENKNNNAAVQNNPQKLNQKFDQNKLQSP